MSVNVLDDLRQLPIPTTYTYRDTSLDLSAFTNRVCNGVVSGLKAHGILPADAGYGVAVTHPLPLFSTFPWNDPQELIAFGLPAGPNGRRYVWNAARKLRAATRTMSDTRRLMQPIPTGFVDIVESQESDGSILWGDFPWGGAVLASDLMLTIGVGVSGFTQVQDHAVAALVAPLILEAIANYEVG